MIASDQSHCHFADGSDMKMKYFGSTPLTDVFQMQVHGATVAQIAICSMYHVAPMILRGFRIIFHAKKWFSQSIFCLFNCETQFR